MSQAAHDPRAAEEDPGSRVAPTDSGSEGASNGTDDFFPSRRHQRQRSLMRQVRDRIEGLPEIAPLQARLELRKAGAHAHRAATLAAISASLTAPELSVRRRAAEPRCQVSFRTALVGTIVASVLLSCLGMFMPLAITRMRLSDEADPGGEAWAQRELEQASGLLQEILFSSTLAGLGDSVRRELQATSDDAVDHLLGLLGPQMLHRLGPSIDWSGGGCDGLVMSSNSSRRWTACAELSGPDCVVWATSEPGGAANCTSPPLLMGRSGEAALARSNASSSGGMMPSAVAGRWWSGVWSANGSLHVARVAPIATGVAAFAPRLEIAAVQGLTGVSRTCLRHWELLRVQLTTSGDGTAMAARDSSLFVVDVDPGRPGQQGLLVGSAHAPPGAGAANASDSPEAAVREAAEALLARFGAWGAAALRAPQSFARGPGPAPGSAAGRRVATVPLDLGRGARWLAVLSLPAATPRSSAGAPGGPGGPRPAAELRARLDEAWRAGVAVLVGVSLLSVGLALGLGCAISAPLRQLDGLMQQLGDFDFSHEAVKASLSARSSITEVCSLQRTFSHLSHAMEAFARFVPETVVRRIVRGDPRAARLHVSRRDVTIMFSDIRDFTAISEALSEYDLLFLLTRYLSVMTRIVECFDGVVAEVLGDGLLVFWNTPDGVADHPAKACQAALAMQQAVAFLNAELARLKLPELAIRVGLHSGRVLSGNLGSEMKMKFGCLGDAINLASRLEGLCKFYGVGVICSGATHDALPAEYGLFCRKLDLVQVKGKSEATWIYELVGNDLPEGQPGGACSSASAAAFAAQARRSAFCKASSTAALDAIRRSTMSLGRTLSSVDGSEAGAEDARLAPAPGELPPDCVSAEQRALAQLYEKALQAYQEARFAAARDLASALLEKHPGDVAAGRLLERVGKYLGPEGDGAARLSEAERAAWTGVFVMAEK